MLVNQQVTNCEISELKMQFKKYDTFASDNYELTDIFPEARSYGNVSDILKDAPGCLRKVYEYMGDIYISGDINDNGNKEDEIIVVGRVKPFLETKVRNALKRMQ
ncbi:hypothetical protein [Priestia megaterium]|uniref:Uncharacterized protein n=1 Tax=Priestia megaterium TaxID=1404 RepID=A0A6M6E067_PRIMG|nr:hypothetical protein [Priestia megaterium]QJX80240.1 hypothetical protein FDZ14_29525 [Priestia megaterium]